MRKFLVAIVVTAIVAGLPACSSGTYSVTAVFDDIGDLQSRGSVQMADVKIGRVGRIRLTDDYKALVTLDLDTSVPVPRSVTALLRQTSLLGERFVELRPVEDAPTTPRLRAGDRITETGEAPELEFVAGEAISVLGAVTAGDVEVLVRTGAEGFGGRGEELGSLLRDLGTFSHTLAERTAEIERIIDGFGSAAEQLAPAAADLGALLDNLATTTRVLADNRAQAVDALDQLSRVAAVQNDVLVRYRSDIERQIGQVDALVAAAAESQAEVASLVDWLARFTTNVPRAVPNDFTQVYLWIVPFLQDPRVER